MSLVSSSTSLPGSDEPDDDWAPPRRRRLLPARVAYPLLSTALFFAVWWAVTAAKVWDPVFVPSPSAVWHQAVLSTRVHDGIRGYGGYLLQEHLWASLRRLVIGSTVGIFLGVLLGLAMGALPWVRHALGPAVTFLRLLPPLAYLSLLIIWLGIDESPKVWLLLIAAMPPVAVATATAVEGIPRDYLYGARSLGASRYELVRWVYLPGALPEILTGVRVGVGVAFTSIVAAETVNGVPGLGGMIRQAQRFNQTDVVVLGILVLGATGLIIDGLLQWLQRRVSPWRGRV